jgi:CSLREA domain-containing protein
MLLGCLLVAGPAHATDMTVNTTADGHDGVAADEICDTAAGPPVVCTLRAAVEEANSQSLSEPDNISVPAGTYQLTTADGGAIEITDGRLNITGAGARQTIIRQQTDFNDDGLDRVFDLSGAFFEVITNISDVTITNGRASSGNGCFGGDIRSTAILTLTRTTITAGNACSGGGLANVGPGSMTIRETAIVANVAAEGGADSGAIANIENGGVDASLTIVNSTISGNSAGNTGGILSWSNGSATPPGNTVNITGSTIAGNTSNINAGGVHTAAGGTATVGSSIIAGNTNTGGASNCGADTGGTNVSNGYNLESGTDCGFTNTGDRQSADPQLGNLGNNGGPTDTRAIPATSPAHDVVPTGALCPLGSIDQRGVARPQGPACDIGAFELEVPPAPPPPAPPPPAPPLPSALSGGAAVLSSRSARLTGTVNPQGLPTTWLFEYGRTTGYGSQTPAVTTGTGTAPEAVSADVAGLTPGTTYHYRLRASNSAGTVFGADRSFTTSRRRLADLPLPAIARTFNVEPVRGRVRVGIPGGAAAARRGSAAQKGVRFVPLEEARQVPVGSYFDVRQGTVRIRSATGTGRRTQQGDFVGALFQMLQRRAGRERGLTEARLKGASFRSCQARGAGAPTDQRHLSRRTVRRLRANARGRFRTRGRYSAATVRGTEWTTTDRCDGTLTSVKRGRVVVRDFRLTRTIVVRAGKSYLARAPG